MFHFKVLPMFRHRKKCKGSGIRPEADPAHIPFNPQTRRYQCPKCGRWIKLRHKGKEMCIHAHTSAFVKKLRIQ